MTEERRARAREVLSDCLEQTGINERAAWNIRRNTGADWSVSSDAAVAAMLAFADEARLAERNLIADWIAENASMLRGYQIVTAIRKIHTTEQRPEGKE